MVCLDGRACLGRINESYIAENADLNVKRSVGSIAESILFPRGASNRFSDRDPRRGSINGVSITGVDGARHFFRALADRFSMETSWA